MSHRLALADIDQQLGVQESGIQVHETSIDLRESRGAIEAEIVALARRMVAKGFVAIPV